MKLKYVSYITKSGELTNSTLQKHYSRISAWIWPWTYHFNLSVIMHVAISVIDSL